MNPATFIPAADTIPVAWGWFEVLKLLTFACHLLLMNAVLGGALMLLFRGKRHRLDELLAKRLPTTLALTVNLGVPPLLFLQVLYGQFFYTAAVLSASFWMLLVALVMGAYGLLYVCAGRVKKGADTGMFLAVAVCALLGTSFILTNVMTLMLRPDVWTAYFTNASGTILNLTDPTLIPRWLHFVLASVAVAGLLTALYAKGQVKAGNATAQARMNLGLRWFNHATLVQIGIGIWWLLALPRDIMLLFMGGNMLHTALFVLSLATTGAALVCGFRKKLMPTVVALVSTVCLMVGMRDLVRMAYLRPYFHPSDLEVVPQYSPMLLFLFSFVAGLAAIAYMFRLHRQDGGGL